MLGRTNTGGGGSGGLNFQVIGGTTAPSNPKENMIWVNTSTKITSYIFSATQPTGSAGMVWISTNTSSTVEFNALKKNGIQVYPIFAKQYIGGAWVDVTAKSYQGGQWVEWAEYLYNKGNEYAAFTGGIEFINAVPSDKYTIGTGIKGDTEISLTATLMKAIAAHTVKKIDLSEYSEISINVTEVVNAGGFARLAIDRDSDFSVDMAHIDLLKPGKYTLDVSEITDKLNVAVYLICWVDGTSKLSFDSIEMR